jgi:hypothetical protein
MKSLMVFGVIALLSGAAAATEDGTLTIKVYASGMS